MSTIRVVGARKNNLRNIDLSIPKHSITAVTGISGSGKSSLLQGTLAAEGAGRMRSFLGFGLDHLEDRESDAFVGPLSPLLHVGQRGFRASSRTTVGTATGILATVRRVFLSVGAPWSGGRPVPPPSPDTYTQWLTEFHEGKATVWAVLARYTNTDGVREAGRVHDVGVENISVRSEKDNYQRAKRIPVRGFKALPRGPRFLIEAEIGSSDVRPESRAELEALLHRAFRAAGDVVVELPGATVPALEGPWGPRLDAGLHWVTPGDPAVYAPPSHHLLSFNQPEHPESGACPRCRGLGRTRDVNLERLIPHPQRSVHEGAIALWTSAGYRHLNIRHEQVEGLRGIAGFDPDAPWESLPDAARAVVLDGAAGVVDRDLKTGRALSKPGTFEGFRHALLRRAGGARSATALEPYLGEGACPECGGSRWSRAARALRAQGHTLPELLDLPMTELAAVARTSFATAPDAQPAGIRLATQADALVSVGLGHLTASRGMTEVSSGESRRARLASVLNASHTGLCLLLDEPARGLHEMDIERLGDALQAAAARHTVILNEHRAGIIARAHQVVELGPGAGPEGGALVDPHWPAPSPEEPRRAPRHPPSGWLILEGATIHNVHDQFCRLPLGAITCFTGVSGSGKSSLLRGAVLPALARSAGLPLPDHFGIPGGTWRALSGTHSVSTIVVLDQTPPQPNRRSLVATYIGVADELREAFARTASARASGLTASDFGLNSGTGRCTRCAGLGEVEIGGEPGPCPACGGECYNARALLPRLGGLNIREVLDTPISQLVSRAPEALPNQTGLLQMIEEVGVGHLTLGRRVDTLSGGEIQRLRIAERLAGRPEGGTFFALDEPAAGLHPRDVARLRGALERALDGGRNTVVLVEHNLELIRGADHIVEVGPGSGPDGGRVLAMGTPAEVALRPVPTGRALSGEGGGHRGQTPVPVRGAPSVDANEWVRRLLDPTLAPDGGELDTTLSPAVPLSRFRDTKRRWLELGDLHLELARLCIELHRASAAAQLRRLESACRDLNAPSIYIHPMLAELQVWGPQVPRSAVLAARRAAELDGAAWEGAATPGDVRVRPRLAEGETSARMRLALRLGGGYVEVRGSGGRVSGGTRLVDLPAGLVAPLDPHPQTASRLSPRGCCPMCGGSGTVETVPRELLIAEPACAPTDERFLHHAAGEILRGVRRNEMLPFFRRLSSEGLWDGDRPFAALTEPERNIVLHGFWCRPGHGSFLKHAGDDPDEVGSWLRWDGLLAMLDREMGRSRDAAWRSAVERSRSPAPCPLCEGTGLGSIARLLRLGESSLLELVRDGDAHTLHAALSALPPPDRRSAERQARLLECIRPVALIEPSLPLRAIAPAGLLPELVGALARTHTDMAVVP